MHEVHKLAGQVRRQLIEGFDGVGIKLDVATAQYAIQQGT